jgi:hypothetical protein
MCSRPALWGKRLSFAALVMVKHVWWLRKVCASGDEHANSEVCRHLFLIYVQTQLIRKPSAYTFNMKTANGRAVLNFTDGLEICVRD